MQTFSNLRGILVFILCYNVFASYQLKKIDGLPHFSFFIWFTCAQKKNKATQKNFPIKYD